MTEWNRQAAVKRAARVLQLVEHAELMLTCLNPRPDLCQGRRSDGRPQFRQVMAAEEDLARIRELLQTPVRSRIRKLERTNT